VKRIQTLGGLAVFEGPRPLGGNAQQPRRLAILAVLARAGERGVSRDRLVGLLWGDVEEERARRSLNQALYALRQELGSEEAILGTRDLRLNSELIEVDLAAFETARASGAFEEAARLYAGPFLGDFHLAGAPHFARWAEGEREGIAADYRTLLEAAAAAATARDDRGGAVLWWRRLAAIDPADTPAALGLMRALAVAGDAPAAIRHADIVHQIRQEELELAPPDATVPISPRRRSLVPYAIAAGVLVLLAGLLVWRRPQPPTDEPGPPRLAVLPFENLGDSADAYFADAYFADGVTDELRGKLAAVSGLEVVAKFQRLSREHAEAAGDRPGAGRGLPADREDPLAARRSRLEPGAGESRADPARARHPPTTRWQQPIDAAHTDVFAVQADIAAKVADALGVVLGDSARRRLTTKPTENLAAYDEYLKGEAASQAMKADQAGLRRAIGYFERAVALDSSFAQAWSQLSRARTSLYSNGVPAPELASRRGSQRSALGRSGRRIRWSISRSGTFTGASTRSTTSTPSPRTSGGSVSRPTTWTCSARSRWPKLVSGAGTARRRGSRARHGWIRARPRSPAGRPR
jgi:DNA-binding SARP family transcriptional activator/TolB-like protein